MKKQLGHLGSYTSDVLEFYWLEIVLIGIH